MNPHQMLLHLQLETGALQRELAMNGPDARLDRGQVDYLNEHGFELGWLDTPVRDLAGGMVVTVLNYRIQLIRGLYYTLGRRPMWNVAVDRFGAASVIPIPQALATPELQWLDAMLLLNYTLSYLFRFGDTHNDAAREAHYKLLRLDNPAHNKWRGMARLAMAIHSGHRELRWRYAYEAAELLDPRTQAGPLRYAHTVMAKASGDLVCWPRGVRLTAADLFHFN